jgi:hypothetical protein
MKAHTYIITLKMPRFSKQQNIIRDILEVQSQGMNEQASLTEQCLDLLGNLCSRPSSKTDTDTEILSLLQSVESKVGQKKRKRTWFNLKRGSSPQKNSNMVSV